MKFFLDTAEVKAITASGLRDGMTANPSLIAKSGWAKTGQTIA